MEQIFIEFLKEHEAYENFIRNLESDREYSCLDELFNYTYCDQWIWLAFIWGDTPEGHDYWAGLDYLWIDITD